jgi:UDP-N-acetyl-L-fucosamine synthase
MEKEKPDAILVLGDTNSALSVIPAKRKKIPIFHMEAGNRCFDERVPEEINRKIVDHTADINLTYSEVAKGNLLREGLMMDRVFNIGSPMLEVLTHYSTKINSSDILQRLSIQPKKYFVLSSHREENVDDHARLHDLFETLSGILSAYPYPIIFSIHPRTEKRLEEAGLSFSSRIIRSKPFCFTDYIALQKNAFCVLSDSGTITEESSILGFPAVNLRETHERQEGMEKAAVTMAGLRKDTVLTAIRLTTKDDRIELDKVADYQQRTVSEKVVRIIVSYADYVQRTVWRKQYS